jgi:hypothetical protein
LRERPGHAQAQNSASQRRTAAEVQQDVQGQYRRLAAAEEREEIHEIGAKQMITQQSLTPELVTWHFLRHFANMLKVPTFPAHLPIAGNLAPLQASATFKDDSTIEALVEKYASDLAERVNCEATAAGASHVSFEELDNPRHVEGAYMVMDKETGVSLRLSWAFDAVTNKRVSRIDVCFRLWKLLPREGA